jgi:hypothetical protein
MKEEFLKLESVNIRMYMIGKSTIILVYIFGGLSCCCMGIFTLLECGGNGKEGFS